jgi:signal transduction histidine kinase/endonuclease/exonuclease/phosphatase family metal-dependent hydrolase
MAVLLAIGAGIAIVVAVRRDRSLRNAEARLERVRAEQTDREQRAGTRSAEETAFREALDSGVLRVDGSLRIAEANGRAHQLLDRTRGSLPGRSVMEAFLDPTVESLVDTALEVGSARGEIHPGGPDGPAISIHAQRIAAGGAWLILEDVSELRRLQRIRAEFIDNLSHELRTPLTTVSLLAETLQREATSVGEAIPTKMRERIAKIEVETGHLVQMVNELLDLSRIESGGTLRLADGVDMGSLAADATERLRMFAERQGVTLAVEREADLPKVRGDAARLGQVVVNLVHNAVKFSPEGGDVTIRTTARGPEVVTSVEDHGIGVPAAARDRVFERFYKVDRARLRAEAGGGTGLGLAIARHVVEQHGGRIWVESVEGSGATFSFALPVTAPSPAADRRHTNPGGPMDRLHVATLNILNLADRWPERLPLVLADMAALQPDLLGLQEVVFVMQQDRLIGAAGEGHYAAIRGWAGRPEYGNSLLVRKPLEGRDTERLDLGLNREAHRTVMELPGGSTLLVVVTHLHHPGAEEAARDEQTRLLVGWLADAPATTALVVMGDFNADPGEPTYRRMVAAGFRSAYAEVHGADPAVTWPSGLQAPAMDTDGIPECLDYIWVRGDVRVTDARLAFDRPAVDDPTLYPSDHLGISVRLEIGEA